MTNDLTAEDLAALTCARVCHDFSNRLLPIGAAIDVLSDPNMDPDMQRDAVELLGEAGALAHAKLEVLRLAFGACDPRSFLDVSAIQDMCRRAFADHDIEFVWRTAGPKLRLPAARILANLVTMAVDTLSRGGTISIDVNESGDRIRVNGEGKRVFLKSHISDGLDGRAPEGGFEPHTIQPYLAGLFARMIGGRASARLDGDRVEFAALAPVSQVVAAP